MSKYLFVVNTTISMHTEVEADSLEEAVELAKNNPVMSLCHQCSSHEDDKYWVTSGEFDCEPGDPDQSPLVEAIKDDEFIPLHEVDW
jgi:hypothetical protein